MIYWYAIVVYVHKLVVYICLYIIYRLKQKSPNVAQQVFKWKLYWYVNRHSHVLNWSPHALSFSLSVCPSLLSRTEFKVKTQLLLSQIHPKWANSPCKCQVTFWPFITFIWAVVLDTQIIYIYTYIHISTYTHMYV